MTRLNKKRHERFIVERAAEYLGKKWNLGRDRECPDFIVTEGAQQFGLEVCEIFAGWQRRRGSAVKERESNDQHAVDDLQREYEMITNTPLCVKLAGDMSAENLATVVPALVAEDLSSKPPGYSSVIDADNGLRVHFTRALSADWFCLNHRAGWVARNAKKHIDDAIEKKSKELPRYREAAGTDIRLLIEANRIFNSGKLMLEEPVSLDVRGFQFVYFFSYAETVTVFDRDGNVV